MSARLFFSVGVMSSFSTVNGSAMRNFLICSKPFKFSRFAKSLRWDMNCSVSLLKLALNSFLSITFNEIKINILAFHTRLVKRPNTPAVNCHTQRPDQSIDYTQCPVFGPFAFFNFIQLLYIKYKLTNIARVEPALIVNCFFRFRLVSKVPLRY